MVFHMKTTLVIPDPVFRELKKRAEDQGTLADLVRDMTRPRRDDGEE